MPENLQDQLDRAREEARVAREAAQRLREEAREMERRIREEARSQRHSRRHGLDPDLPHPRGPRPWGLEDPSENSEREEPAGAEVREDLSLDGVRQVVIDQSAGKLTVRLCAEGEAPVVVSASNKTPPRLLIARDGDRLTIAIKQQAGWLFRRRSGATSLVRLRGEFASIRINLGYGEMQLRDLVVTTFDLDAGAGTITTYSCRGSVKANVGAGRVALNDHAGLAHCETGTGDIQVDIAEAAPGEYRANAGMGRAEFYLPAGLTVHTRASSGIGRAKIEYPNAAEDAPIQVRIETGIGEAAVKERRAGKEPTRPPAPPPRAGSFAPQKARRRESEEIRVLQLLEQGRISSQEAAELLAALQGAPPPLDEDDGT